MFEKLKILWHYVRAKQGDHFKDRASLEKWQDNQVQKFLKHILPRSAFYQQQLHGIDLCDWQKAPIIDKSVMMDNFNELNTVGITKDDAFAVAYKAEKERNFAPTIGRITVGLSSGTSGNRGLFLVSPEERCKWAGYILAKVLPGSLFDQHKIAFFLRANSNLYTTVNSRNLQVEFFDLLKPIDEHVAKLNDFKPTLLIAQPQMLLLLARAIEEGHLSVHPHKIVSVAEVLDPMDEAHLTNAFGQKIHQVYQATEGFIAATCKHGILHLNEDIIVVQKKYVDKALGKFVPIITDFSRTTQPIIRYRLNDILTERKEPCSCGSAFTAIEKIEGRSDDMLYFIGINKKDRIRVFPDFISRSIINASSVIEEYKVSQKADGEIFVQLKLTSGLGEASGDSIKQAITRSMDSLAKQLAAKSPLISFGEYTAPIKGEKLKRIERLKGGIS